MAITDMGIAQIREGLASKRFSAREVAQASLDHIAEAGYEITGDYVGEEVLDSELFSFSGRDELIKLQVPVRKRA